MSHKGPGEDIQFQINSLKNQIELLDRIFNEYNSTIEKRYKNYEEIFCLRYYYDYILYKFGCRRTKKN